MENNKEVVAMLEDIVDNIINKVVENKCPAELSEEIIVFAIKSACKRGYLTTKSYNDLKRRADNFKDHKGRTLTQFFVHIKQVSKREDGLCREFIRALQNRGETASYENYGNKDAGRVRILNYNSEPDIKLTRNGKKMIMDVKSLNKQWFKMGDLQLYSKKNAGMIIKSKGFFWIYSPYTVQKMTKQGKREKWASIHPKYHKTIVKMGEEGEEKTFPLKKLVAEGLIEQIPCGDKK